MSNEMQGMFFLGVITGLVAFGLGLIAFKYLQGDYRCKHEFLSCSTPLDGVKVYVCVNCKAVRAKG